MFKGVKSYNQNEVLSDDLGHYTHTGSVVFTEYMNKYLNIC